MTTVLVVDDNPVDQKIASRCVSEHGATSLFAKNGREAMEIVERERPNIVLTDLQMPEMDGLSLVRRIRQSHPGIPVMLMTAFGSEDIAVQALQAGATSYIRKRILRQELGGALQTVMSSVPVASHRDKVREFLNDSDSEFVLGYQPDGPQILVNYLQDCLERLNFCDPTELMRIGTALYEALVNAIDHGNLELDSELRDTSDHYDQLREERIRTPPYNGRTTSVKFNINSDRAVFRIRDQGPGFDPTNLPDPTDSENLLNAGGRGVMLILSFMDEVTFNAKGNEITMQKFRRTH
ncbi:MAG: response regulator [Planctomycetota bacterium]